MDGINQYDQDRVALWATVEFSDADFLAKGETAALPDAIAFGGLISAQNVDKDGDILRADGANWKPWLTPDLTTGLPSAPITWRHPNVSTNVIGRGTALWRVNEKGIDGWRNTGVLMGRHPMTAEAMRFQRAAISAGMPGLGQSVEGRATKRNPVDRHDILEWDIWSDAVDPAPRNPQCIIDMMQLEALTKGGMDHSPPVREYIEMCARFVAHTLDIQPMSRTDTIRKGLVAGIPNDELRAFRVWRELRHIANFTFDHAMEIVRGVKDTRVITSD